MIVQNSVKLEIRRLVTLPDISNNDISGLMAYTVLYQDT